MYSFHLSVLSLSTNLLKHTSRPGQTTLHKAAPTVSISNTYAERDTSPQNSIPFPSAPISCPATTSTHHDLEMQTVDGAWELVGSSSRADPWHLDIQRRRSQSCLATSFVHRDNHAMPSPPPEPSRNPPIVPARRRKLAAKRPKVPSAPSRPMTVVVKKKAKRSTRRYTADVQLTAKLHQSLASGLRAATSYTLSTDTAPSSESALLLRQQDRILVERLWHSLVDQGLRPVPLLVPSDVGCPLPSDPDPFALDPARVEHVFQSEPISCGERKASSTCDEAAPGLPTPPPSPQRSSPITVPMPRHASSSHSLPTPPTTPPHGSDVHISPMPQLVASLILRHRDRSATRPRSSSACSAGVRAERGRSPLCKSIASPLPA